MKRFFNLIAITLAIVVSSCNSFDDTEIWNKLNNHENRIVALEELCKQMNTNISALQSVVNVLQKNDYITNVAPVRKDGEEVGFTITFAYGDTITIYHGQNGKNGENGYTPQISVMKDTDGIYYWAIDGEWLLDDKGNKIKAQGFDGQNGSNGITPRLKIEDDYWYISYDNGNTWEKLGKATGADGDSIFSSVTQDDEYVYFYLADGSMITLPKHDKENIQFEDLQVKAICCKHWDTNSDGELSYTEAAAVTAITNEFYNNTSIIAFTEFKHFVGLTEIPANAFKNCTSLWKIFLPKSITSIGDGAFYSCNSLTNIVIHGNVKYLGVTLFAECNKLTKVKIHHGVAVLGNSIFWNCGNLKDIELPESITEIGSTAFYNCHNLSKINIPQNITIINSSIFDGCMNLSEIKIPDQVTKICNHAFSGCVNLTSIVIPKYVNFIENGAFDGCNKLDSIYCKPATPPAIYYFNSYSPSEGEYGSFPLNANMRIYVPQESYDLYTAYSFQYNVNSISIENWGCYESYIVPYNFE